jgi:molybdopterin converting factor small subunit
VTVSVEVTYDMSKELGAQRFEVEAATVRDAVQAARKKFDDATTYERLSARTAIAVNGVLVRYRKSLDTPLVDGDRVSFVKAAAGG